MALQPWMFTVAALFLFAEAAAQEWPVPAPEADGAYPDCPCAHNTGNRSLASLFPARVQVKNGALYLSSRDGGLVSADYGSGRCSDWDASGLSSTFCSGAERPDWCENRWCYINKDTCSRNFRPSYEFPGQWFSYNTCGFLDMYISPANRIWNSTRPLYAFAFGFRAQANPEAASSNMNTFLHFAADVFERVGITPEIIRYRTLLSNATRRKLSSTYSGCVHDVALGNLDLCLGDIWDTEERQGFGSASFVQVMSEPMMLVTPVKSNDGTWWERLLKPFIPFAWDLWVMIFAVIITTGLVMTFFEFHRNDSDFEMKGLIGGLGKSMYLSVSSFVNAGTAYGSVTLSGRILSIGYGIFILVCTATFTAMTATSLISTSLIAKANSIDDALTASSTVCYSAGMQPMLESKYPRMKKLGVPLDSSVARDFASALANKECDVAIVGDRWMDDLHESGEFCDLSLVGTTILSFPMGYWVSEELRPNIAWAVAQSRAKGILTEVQRLYKKETSCKTKAHESDQVSASHMLGAFMVFVTCLVLAGIVRCFEMSVFGLAAEDKDLENEIVADFSETVHNLTHRRRSAAAERDDAAPDVVSVSI